LIKLRKEGKIKKMPVQKLKIKIKPKAKDSSVVKFENDSKNQMLDVYKNKKKNSPPSKK
jgi:hypothetical protein